MFFVERVYLSCYSQKQGRSLSNSGNKIQKKKKGGKIYSRTHTFRAKVPKSNIWVKRWHSKCEILKNIERHNFWLNYLPTGNELLGHPVLREAGEVTFCLVKNILVRSNLPECKTSKSPVLPVSKDLLVYLLMKTCNYYIEKTVGLTRAPTPL